MSMNPKFFSKKSVSLMMLLFISIVVITANA